MFRKLAVSMLLLAMCLLLPVCAEKKVEEDRSDIEVDAPGARVRVNLPDEARGKRTRVKVDVDD